MANNRFDFTEAAIAALSSPEKGKRAYCYDSVTRGLGVSVTPAGTKTFVLYRWLDGKPERITLGRFPDLSIAQARKLAADANTKIAYGINPNEEKKRLKAGRAISLVNVLTDFLAAKNNLSRRTVYDYRRMVHVYLHDWRDIPVASITQEMVEHRHHAIASGMKLMVSNRKGAIEEIEVCSEAQANYSMRVLRALINFAIKHYKSSDGRPLLADNPVKQMYQAHASELAHQGHVGIRPYDLKAWFHAVMNLKSDAANAKPEVVKSFLIFLLMTGMKRHDAEKLRKTQIDFKARTLTIFDIEHRQPYVLPLSDYLYIMLKQLAEVTDGPYIFPGNGPRGYLIDPRKQLLKISEESGVRFTLHDLRRTFIIMAESLDIPAYALRRLLDYKAKHDVVPMDAPVDVEKLRKPMQMVTDHMLKCAEVRKSVDMIALLSGHSAGALQEKLSHILAVRRGVEANRQAGSGKLRP